MTPLQKLALYLLFPIILLYLVLLVCVWRGDLLLSSELQFELHSSHRTGPSSAHSTVESFVHARKQDVLCIGAQGMYRYCHQHVITCL